MKSNPRLFALAILFIAALWLLLPTADPAVAPPTPRAMTTLTLTPAASATPLLADALEEVE